MHNYPHYARVHSILSASNSKQRLIVKIKRNYDIIPSVDVLYIKITHTSVTESG